MCFNELVLSIYRLLPGCLTPLVKGLLVLFLFIIPLIILIAFCSYRHKEQLRARWRVYQETKKGGVHDTKAS